MKIQLLLLITVVLFKMTGFAQNICFSYDDAGNRIGKITCASANEDDSEEEDVHSLATLIVEEEESEQIDGFEETIAAPLDEFALELYMHHYLG